MMKHKSVIILTGFTLLSFVSNSRLRGMDFGFTYWPAGHNCDVLYEINWTTENIEIVKADLDIMASYSSKILRLMVWPQVSGYLLYNGTNGGNWGDGGVFIQDFDDVTDNLLDIVEMCDERGIEIIMSFGNQYHTSLYQTDPKIYWWELGYDHPSDPQAHLNFCTDSVTWINGFVDKIEASLCASTVIYYDYHPEWSSLRTMAGEYIRYIYDNSNIPSGKRFVSPLIIDDWHNDAADLRAALGQRTVDCADVHSYPYLGHCEDIEHCYDLVAASFPSVPIYIGEFGSNDNLDETAMQTLVLDITTRAAAKGYTGVTHWMLWDNAPPKPNAIYAWGYDAHSPKDVMGGMAELLTLVPNPDMEKVNGIEPADWSAQGDVPLTFYYNNSAATNSLCARILVNNTTGSVSLDSSLIPVTGGQKLFAGFYVRATMDNVRIKVTEYDQNQDFLAVACAPWFTPDQWQWYNYIRATQSWFAPLTGSTRYVRVSVCADVRANPSILDVDTVAVYESGVDAKRSDFNNDSAVNTLDLSALIGKWLESQNSSYPDCRYDLALPQDNIINLKDFEYLTEEWQGNVQ